MKNANIAVFKAMVNSNNVKNLYTLCGSLCSGPHKSPKQKEEYHAKMAKVIGK